MTAVISEAIYINNVVTAASSRGVTSVEALEKIREDARIYWADQLNTYSGTPASGPASN
jgi:hypothetical protein